jgi:hypothetical protein
VDGATQLCAFSPCAREVFASLRVRIDGVGTELWACHSHEEWLRDYVQEDAAVLLVEEDGAAELA